MLGFVDVRWDGGHTLWLKDKKISGNSFHYRKNISLHHGTLLVATDLDLLQKVLSPDPVFSIESFSVASITAPVINLSDIIPELSWEEVAEHIVKCFINAYPHTIVEITEESDYAASGIDESYRKYASWSWIYGESPRFTIRWIEAMQRGMVTLTMDVCHAMISGISLYSEGDTTELDKINDILKTALVDCAFNAQAIAARLKIHQSKEINRQYLNELADLIAFREF
jgi:lipoate-protein ligase A